MVVIFVPDEVADNAAAMTQVIHNMWLGDWTSARKEYCSLHQATPKGYPTTFKMCTTILVTKLDGENIYAQVCTKQDVVGMLLLTHGIYCEYNSECQDTYAIMQDKNLWRYSSSQRTRATMNTRICLKT